MEKVSKQHAGGHILNAGGHDYINATAAAAAAFCSV